jgi:hypothetical protein
MEFAVPKGPEENFLNISRRGLLHHVCHKSETQEKMIFGFEESGALTFIAPNRVATIANEPQRNVPHSLSDAAEERLRDEMDGSKDSSCSWKIIGGSK